MTQARSLILIATLAVLVSTDVLAQRAEYTIEERAARFQLFTGCARMGLVVEDIPSGAGQIGLTRGAITRAVESRLRSARLYTADRSSGYYLYVRVGVLDMENRRSPPFNIEVTFNQLLYNPLVDDYRSARTWDRGSYGQGDSQFILGAISGWMDEYLRVDEDACDAR